jgi:hypothetical protein
MTEGQAVQAGRDQNARPFILEPLPPFFLNVSVCFISIIM